jgi:hypothetical protein
MRQAVVRKLYNPAKCYHVRKDAHLLAQALNVYRETCEPYVVRRLTPFTSYLSDANGLAPSRRRPIILRNTEKCEKVKIME